ncbi:hypothetical protein [Streptomyces sp. MP131-18]|uniref:hypothetical protein n=1 Tax=Streptomyces sp. MP131-18 TaxID=1857892 RepID=UPI00097C1516|nr:hypothetical protein [Streptomyces sp. MP131-18]
MENKVTDALYCLNCRTSECPQEVERHAVPCLLCSSDGHAACQHAGPVADPSPSTPEEVAAANSLFVEELDGSTLTPDELRQEAEVEQNWRTEQYIARNFGDGGQSLHTAFSPEEGGY